MLKEQGPSVSRALLMRYGESERRWEISDQRHRTEADLRRMRRYLRIQTQCGVLEAVGQSRRGERRLAEKIWLRHE